jgi:MFS family permease
MLSPMLLTLVITSFLIGRRISVSGHYRIYPIAGTILVTIGFSIVALATQVANEWLMVGATVVIALGIGSIMQVIVLAIQNSVRHNEIGVATSTERLFRSLGAAAGVAIAGVILSLHLVGLSDLAETSDDARAVEGFLSGSGSGDLSVQSLPGDAQTLLGDEVAGAMRSIFLAAIPLAVAGFVVSLRLQQLPLHHDQTYRARSSELVS